MNAKFFFIFKFVEAGSSRSSLLLHFVGMGFSEDTVAKAIKDNGLFFFLFFYFLVHFDKYLYDLPMFLMKSI